MYGLDQPILRTDVSGMPLEWVDYQEAVRLHCSGHIAYTVGPVLHRLRGGFNAITARRSVIVVHAVIATHGGMYAILRARPDYVPPLSNAALFRRDFNMCLYCGQIFAPRELSRDHITPLVQGGADRWANVVTACRRCNHHKGGRTPEQAGMQLLAVPFSPTHAEYVYLQGRRILADQMAFLRAHFPRSSPLHARLDGAVSGCRVA